MKNKKSICIFAGSTAFVLLLAAVFASIVMMPGNVPVGMSVLELPTDNVVFKPVLQGFGIQIQDDSICTTKKNINNYYPELLKENSVNKGLMFCKRYDFYNETIFKREFMGSLEIFQRHSAKDIHLLFVDNDDSKISFDAKSKDRFTISFLSSDKKDLTIMRQTGEKSFDLISCEVSNSRPRLSCDVTILVGTYEKSEDNTFVERKRLTPVVTGTNIKLNPIQSRQHKH
jgi:hypothetical protein